MRISCKNYDFVDIMTFLSAWFGWERRLKDIPQDELAKVIETFLGG